MGSLLIICFVHIYHFLGVHTCDVYLPLLLAYKELEVGVINYGTFVSIDSMEFLELMIMLNALYGNDSIIS